jgi:oligopeptide/dipeptide ABC transporter ATP-binding protein
VTAAAEGSTAFVVARDLTKHFPVRKGVRRKTVGYLQAVDGVNLEICLGETMGLVGESGCGKSTLGRLLLRLMEPTSGDVVYDGVDFTKLGRNELRRKRRDVQIVFQDPFGSLDPRKRIGPLVEEGLRIHEHMSAGERKERVVEMLERVGLGADAAGRYPHQFSGGQRQRIALARALVLRPRFLVLDEPVSALDVSIQSQVLNLLVELKQALDLTYLFIAHDLAVVSYLADRIAVMYLGKIVELGASADIVSRQLHPYTQALLSANPEPVPGFKRGRIVLAGDVPTPIDPPSGCRFRTRCPISTDLCAEASPPLTDHGDGHLVACHYPGTPIAQEAAKAAR